MLVLCCTGLPITITLALAGEWLNSLILQDDNKCIKLMNRQLATYLFAMIAYVM